MPWVVFGCVASISKLSIGFDFLLYNFRDHHDRPSYCKVSLKGFLKMYQTLIFFFFFFHFKPCHSCSLWVHLWNNGSYWSSNSADDEVDHFHDGLRRRKLTHHLFFMPKMWLKMSFKTLDKWQATKGSQITYLNSLNTRQSLLSLSCLPPQASQQADKQFQKAVLVT